MFNKLDSVFKAFDSLIFEKAKNQGNAEKFVTVLREGSAEKLRHEISILEKFKFSGFSIDDAIDIKKRTLKSYLGASCDLSA